MQYFPALKLGEMRVKAAQKLLEKYSGNALPALALKDNNDNNWEPVGEENCFCVIKEESGYTIAICDGSGIAKSISQWFNEEKKDEIVSEMVKGNISEYHGKIVLPI
jgi:hypothetical protein